jgi:hypothetical protein
MQQRRFRPGDVLDDYCPRERRITDHAIVAMIDDHIKQTRCVVCDAEHEYKDGKVPPRRKKPQAGLFAQVLDGLQGPQPAARVSAQADGDVEEPAADETLALAAPAPEPVAAVHPGSNGRPDALAAVVARDEPLPAPAPTAHAEDVTPASGPEEGLWRRPLIRAALPRPEGQPPPQTRPAPDFTVRQPTNNRATRHGRKRGAAGHSGASASPYGPMRSGRGSHGPGQGQGQGQGQGAGRSRRRRGGKKNH